MSKGINQFGLSLLFAAALVACGGSGGGRNGSDDGPLTNEAASQDVGMDGAWLGAFFGDDASRQAIALVFDGSGSEWRSFEDGGSILAERSGEMVSLIFNGLAGCSIELSGIVEPGQGSQIVYNGTFASSPECGASHAPSGSVWMRFSGSLDLLVTNMSGDWGGGMFEEAGPNSGVGGGIGLVLAQSDGALSGTWQTDEYIRGDVSGVVEDRFVVVALPNDVVAPGCALEALGVRLSNRNLQGVFDKTPECAPSGLGPGSFSAFRG